MHTTNEFTKIDTAMFDSIKHRCTFLQGLVKIVQELGGEIALSVGGSVAVGKNVGLSDLDLFLYIGDRNAFEIAKMLRTSLSLEPGVLTTCPVSHYDSFGCRCAWTLSMQPVSLVELFVSSSVDLKPTPMARHNRLLIDGSTKYKEYLKASNSCVDEISEEVLELILHNLVSSAQKTRRWLMEKSFVQAANRLYKYRMALLPILIFASTNQLHHPLVGEKHLDALDSTIGGRLAASYAVATIADLDREFHALTLLLSEGMKALSRSGRISEFRSNAVYNILLNYASRCN
jgi:hypothetical protein